MPFGVYHQSPPSELNAELPRADGLFGLGENSLEQALIACPHDLKAQTERILATFKDSGTSLDDERAIDKAVALLANAHASSVVSGNRAQVNDKVDEAHEIAHAVRSPCPAFVAQTTRLKARSVAASGDFESARGLFEGIESERDPAEGSARHPAKYRDAIELALLKLCVTPTERESLAEFPEKEYRIQCAEISRQLDLASHCSAEAKVGIAKDLLWLTFHYGRYPLLRPEPLHAICLQAQRLLGGAGSPAGELEAIRLMGAIALERGEYRRSGEIFASALRLIPKGEVLQTIEFLHAAGEALSCASEPDYSKGIVLLGDAARMASQGLAEEYATFYHLELAEALLNGWRVDDANAVLARLDEDLVRASDHQFHHSRLTVLKARVLDIGGEPRRASALLRDALTASALRDVSADSEVGTEIGRQVQARLDQLKATHRLPLTVEEFECSGGAGPTAHRETLARLLIDDLARDRSPWIAELLFRVELAAVRNMREAGSVDELLDGLEIPTALIREFEKLRCSTRLPELLIERGLQLVSWAKVPEAKQAFETAIDLASRYGDRGLGIVWCGHAALFRMQPDGIEVARAHARAARGCEQRIMELGHLVDARDYLDRRYRIAKAFG